MVLCGLFISTFGNALTPSSQILEIFFCIALVIGGLALFLLLIGNIQACFHQHFTPRTSLPSVSRFHLVLC